MQPITQSIFANNNLAISMSPGSWQLSIRTTAATENIEQAERTLLVEASVAGLSYQVNFARARNLPEDLLPANQIETVVVGWERKDGCWYLGLLLTTELTETRGARWCGLARWSDPTGLIEFQSAEMAGRVLADTLRRPFRLVTDQLRTETVADDDGEDNSADISESDLRPDSSIDMPSDGLPGNADELAAAARLTGVVQSEPPVLMGDWMLAKNENGLIWHRSRAWRRGMIVRLTFFFGLALLFVVLSIGGLSSIFAPVQPDWLPLVGLVVAIVLAINAILHLIRLFSAELVEFDLRLQMVRWQHPAKGVVRQVPFEKVQYILTSYTVLRAERLKGTTPIAAFEQLSLETWLHVARDIGDFIEFGHVAPVDGRGVHQAERQPRHPLDLTEIDTPVHHAAQLIAAAMNVPSFVEQRN